MLKSISAMCSAHQPTVSLFAHSAICCRDSFFLSFIIFISTKRPKRGSHVNENRHRKILIKPNKTDKYSFNQQSE